MNEALDALKALGAEKVHEDTHISRKNIEAIFSRSYGGMNPVQFGGFVSILEREYGLDLSGLKNDFLAYWEVHHAEVEAEEEAGHLPSPSERRGIRLLLAVAAVAAAITLYMLGSAPEPAPEAVPEADATEYAVPAEPEVPAPQQSVPTEPAVVETAVEVPEAAETLSITPKSKLWVGFIDLETNLREQALTTDTLEVDTNRSWLMVFGHGYFSFEHNGEILDYNSTNRLRFIYEDGTLREITRAEFKERNRGQNW